MENIKELEEKKELDDFTIWIHKRRNKPIKEII